MHISNAQNMMSFSPGKNAGEDMPEIAVFRISWHFFITFSCFITQNIHNNYAQQLSFYCHILPFLSFWSWNPATFIRWRLFNCISFEHFSSFQGPRLASGIERAELTLLTMVKGNGENFWILKIWKCYFRAHFKSIW